MKNCFAWYGLTLEKLMGNDLLWEGLYAVAGEWLLFLSSKMCDDLTTTPILCLPVPLGEEADPREKGGVGERCF